MRASLGQDILVGASFQLEDFLEQPVFKEVK